MAAARMTTNSFSVGDLRVLALSDGISKVPLDSFPGADYDDHRSLVDADGTMHLPIGVFIIRTGGHTVMIDAGLGRLQMQDYPDVFDAGHLAGPLREAGVDPSEIDIVACSHIHLDHAGWMADGGQTFSNATVRFGAGDWDEFMTPTEANFLVPEDLRSGLRTLADQGRLELIERDGETIAPGINAMATPGHTQGHQSFVISSGTDRVIILGDSIVCPLQITGPQLSVVAETDPALAATTREAVLREVEGTSTRVTGPRFPGLVAGRVLAGKGKRSFVVN